MLVDEERKITAVAFHWLIRAYEPFLVSGQRKEQVQRSYGREAPVLPVLTFPGSSCSLKVIPDDAFRINVLYR